MATRGPDGRWLKAGGELPADGSGPPTVVPIVEPANDPSPASGWGMRRVTAGFAVDIDAGHIVDAMTRAWLKHTRDALMTGQRPDGGGEQKPLSDRALADPDRESTFRGFNSGELADGLRRTEIKSNGQTASATVYPPTSRTAYVAKEQRRGVVLITGAGAAGEAAMAGARQAAELMTSGRKIESSRGEVVAEDAEP